MMLLLIAFLGIFAPLVAPKGPYKVNVKLKEAPPSREHFLGNDAIGRDNWARLVYATRVSLSVGVGAVAIQVMIGTTLGLVSGFYGGRVDMIVQRLTDVVLSFPWILIIIVFVAVFGAGLRNLILAIGLFGWTGITRIIRAEVLSLREREFMMAARCTGASNRRIIFRHILPNVVAPLVVVATLGVAFAIITETSLSFLGLGVGPPTPSWGNMIHQAQSLRVLEEKPWIWIPPGLFIAISVLSINFIGDGLRDALDPRMRL
jgi:peptide/nickel transport system permease protein